MEPPLSEMAVEAADPDEPCKRQDSRRKRRKRSPLRRKTWGRHKHLSRFCPNRSLNTRMKHESSNSRARSCSTFCLQQEARYGSSKLLKDSAMDLMKARFAPHSKSASSRRYATASLRIRR